MRGSTTYGASSLHTSTTNLYGHQYEDYADIRRKVYRDRDIRKSIESLQQRLKMLMLMYRDCHDLIFERRSRLLYEGQLRVMYRSLPTMVVSLLFLAAAVICVSYLTYVIVRA